MEMQTLSLLGQLFQCRRTHMECGLPVLAVCVLGTLGGAGGHSSPLGTACTRGSWGTRHPLSLLISSSCLHMQVDPNMQRLLVAPAMPWTGYGKINLKCSVPFSIFRQKCWGHQGDFGSWSTVTHRAAPLLLLLLLLFFQGPAERAGRVWVKKWWAEGGDMGDRREKYMSHSCREWQLHTGLPAASEVWTPETCRWGWGAPGPLSSIS